MPWNTLTAADVMEEFTPQEQAALQAIQAGSTQMEAILDKVVAAARGSILAGGNDLDAAGTLPDQVIPAVVSIARWRFLIAFPKLKGMQTEERRDAYRDGNKLIEKIAAGDLHVERPATAIATTGEVVNLPSVGPKTDRPSRRREDGII